MMLKHYSLIFLLFLSFQLHSQQLIDPASLPDVEDYTLVRTNPSADTIILALHGGPTSELFEGSFTYMESIPTFSVVEVMKQEMLVEVLDLDSLSREEGIAINDTTAALIEKAVQYYKNLDKTVVLLGHSWGALVLGEFLDDYGADHVHRIIPMEGRLSVQQEFVDYLYAGVFPNFAMDGMTIIPDPLHNYSQSLLTFAGALFENRWTDSLANSDLSNMMFTYAEYDENTGALIDEELDFLDNVGARTLFIPDDDHGASYDAFYQKIIVNFIREQLLTDVNAPQTAQSLHVFPTLATQQIQIDSDQSGELYIYDLMGRPVQHVRKSANPLSLDVSNLQNGQYVVVLQDTENGLSTARFQVIDH